MDIEKSMKVSELLEIEKILRTFSKEKIGIESAYNIARFLSMTQNDISFFKQKIKDFVEEYSLKDESGKPRLNDNGNILLNKELLPQYINEISELNNLEIEVPELKIKYKDLQKIDIAPEALIILIPYIIK